jgi:hypothetical protein
MTSIKLVFCALVLLGITGIEPEEYDFATILNQDRRVLAQGVFYGDTSSLYLFNKFAHIDISRFKHNTKKSGDHKIDIWSSPTNQIYKIVKVTSKIPIDTVIYETDNNGNKVITENVKVTFEFVTYQFKQKNYPSKLIYTTIKHEGLDDYYIEDNEYYISYISAFVGMDLVYKKTKKQIINILNEN